MQRSTDGGRLGASLAMSRRHPCSADDSDASHRPLLAGINELERLLNRAGASWHSSPQLIEHRAGHRVRYTRPVLITPLDSEAQEPVAAPFLVTARDLSPGGLSFLHRDPLACRLVAVRFPAIDAFTDAVLTRLNWCRFTREGLYQSGGTFLRAVRLPPMAGMIASDSSMLLDAVPVAQHV
jgi:hypothetical protein